MDLKKESDFYETFSGSEEGIKKVPMQCKTFKKKRKLKNWLPTQVFFKWSLVFVAQKVLPIKFFTFFFIVTWECICDFFYFGKNSLKREYMFFSNATLRNCMLQLQMSSNYLLKASDALLPNCHYSILFKRKNKNGWM